MLGASAAFAEETTPSETTTVGEFADRDPAQEPNKSPKKPDTGLGSRSTSDTEVRRYQLSVMGGIAIAGRRDFDTRIYKHDPARSPVGRFAWQVAFIPESDFQFLLGVEGLAIQTVAAATSSLATATYTSDDVYAGPSIGFGWSPSGPGTPFQLQAILVTGWEYSHIGKLESPGFTTAVKDNSLTSFTIWGGLYGSYSVTPAFRLTGGFAYLNNTRPFMMGVAYAF